MATMHYPVTFIDSRTSSRGDRMVVYLDREGEARLVMSTEKEKPLMSIGPNATVLRHALENAPTIGRRHEDNLAAIIDALRAYAYARSVNNPMPLDDYMNEL